MAREITNRAKTEVSGLQGIQTGKNLLSPSSSMLKFLLLNVDDSYKGVYF